MASKLNFKGVQTNVNKRFENGEEHHPDALELMEELKHIDAKFNKHEFSEQLEIGGDGDAGENILYLLDIYFDAKDKTFWEDHNV